MNVSRPASLAVLLLLPIAWSGSGCDIFKDQSCYIDRKLVSAEGDDQTFHVGMRFRAFVHDRNDIPVEGVRVEFTHWKLHCDGRASPLSDASGETNENGVFSTQLKNTYPTYSITTHDDDIRIRLSANIGYQSIDAQAASWRDRWVYAVPALQRLPLSGNSRGGYRERMLVHEVTLEYPYPN